jgi:hypothetical protein
MNVAGIAAIAAMSAMWAGGGLASGFELAALWILPLTACTLPWRDLAAQIALILAGWRLAAHRTSGAAACGASRSSSSRR